MRLEHLPDGSPDGPLIRLFDFTPAEAARLGAAITALAAGYTERVAIHDLPGAVQVGGCELVLLRRPWDQAVVQVGPSAFECGFTAGAWDDVAGRVEPFAAGGNGYQWLAGIPGEASLLLSASGEW